MATPTRFDRHPYLTGLALMVWCLGIADCVVGCNLSDGKGVPHPYFHHGLPTGFRGQVHSRADVRAWVSTNSLAFKDAEPREVPLQSDRYRVLFMGDSFTEGVGMTWEETFVGQIAASFHPARVEVLNAGVVSYSPKLHHLKLQYYLEQVGLHVDEVQVFIDLSDPIDELIYADFQAAASFSLGDATAIFLVRHSWLLRTLQDFLPFGPALRTVTLNPQDPLHSHVLRSRWAMDDPEFEKYGKPGLALARASMDALFALCAKHHIQVGVAVYPWPSQIVEHDLPSRHETFWRDVAQTRGARFIDFFPYFMSAENPISFIGEHFIPYDMHWNAIGHRRIAQGWLAQRCAGAADALPCSAQTHP